MRVQVHKRYAGKRAQVPIEVGIYQEGAEELYGLEIFLRDNGNARFLPDEVAEVEPVVKVVEEAVKVAEVAEEEADKEADEQAHGISGTKRRGRKKS
jgi:hypothetical protein